MIDRKMFELMNLVLDGVATPLQQAELETYLIRNPEARSDYDALSRLTHRLDNQPMTDPPAELEPRILEAVHGMAAEGVERSWLRGFFGRPVLRPWSTFGLGLAAGVLLFAAIQWGRPGIWDAARDIDASHVSGTMEKPVGREAVGSILVDTDDATGSASVYQEGRNMVVDIHLESTAQVEWELGFDSNSWTLLRVERRGTATREFAANAGVIEGAHTGKGGVRLVFSGPAEAARSVDLKILQGGKPVFEGTPTLAP
jgi:hypothetical protein